MISNQSCITAIGTAVPAFKQTQTNAAEMVAETLQLKPAEKRRLKSIYRSTNINTRHSVLSDFCAKPGEFTFFPNDFNADFPSTAARMKVYQAEALTLALAAIQDCFHTQKNFNPNQITHIITVSCTGMYAPGLDLEIVQQLKLNPTIQRTAINFMGCYGAFNAIKMADAICRSQSSAAVLIVSVELCTLHFQKNETLDNIVANAIFADGAGALLIQPAHVEKKSLLLENFYCDVLWQHNQAMTWQIGDQGFDIVLSSYVPAAIESGIAALTQRLLASANLSREEIAFFAIHPGGDKILRACETALAIQEEDNRYSYQVLRDYGNMSSATVIFVLKQLWHDVDFAQNLTSRILSCAFGPGLTLESMLLKINM